MVSMFGKFNCAEGKGDEMDAALSAQTAASEGIEGIESYSYHKAEDGTYFFYALLSDMGAMETLSQTDAMQEAMPKFMALLAGPPEMSVTKPISA